METDEQPEEVTEKTDTTLVSEPDAPPPTLSGETDPQRSDAPLTSMPPMDSATPSVPAPGATAPVAQATRNAEPTTLPPIPHPHSFQGPARGKVDGVPLTLNQLAIVAASQNKLPTSRVKGIVMRMGRHTQSSAGKQGRWYKNDNYVDPANYSWRNMELFIDYQKQMYTPFGTIKASCKKNG
ncbi:uncharacterized protein [Littorina saxatilis]|uniref:Uncharacterized protein n=2 Tax=Littorina saxatilis TaxID=31220 RepID=A0AAN9G4V8_9CAEN